MFSFTSKFVSFLVEHRNLSTFFVCSLALEIIFLQDKANREISRLVSVIDILQSRKTRVSPSDWWFSKSALCDWKDQFGIDSELMCSVADLSPWSVSGLPPLKSVYILKLFLETSKCFEKSLFRTWKYFQTIIEFGFCMT